MRMDLSVLEEIPAEVVQAFSAGWKRVFAALRKLREMEEAEHE